MCVLMLVFLPCSFYNSIARVNIIDFETNVLLNKLGYNHLKSCFLILISLETPQKTNSTKTNSTNNKLSKKQTQQKTNSKNHNSRF